MSPNPVIVVVAFNRPQALRGLLDSLLHADYAGLEVELVISIDGGGDKAVTALADGLDWPYGQKVVIKHPASLGLKNHMIACGSLTSLYDTIIVLEDDLEVAPGFYKYTLAALDVCAHEPSIAGISLYSYGITECTYQQFGTYPDGHDTYLMQFPSSWGQVWNREQWKGFLDWISSYPNKPHTVLPLYVQRWGSQSWKKLFLQYMMDEGKYFLYPKQSYSTNKGYPGTHFALRLTLFDVPLYRGADLTMSAIGDLQRFDAYFEMEAEMVTKLAGTIFQGSFEMDLWKAKDVSLLDVEYVIGPFTYPSAMPIPPAMLGVLQSLAPTDAPLVAIERHLLKESPNLVRVEIAEYNWLAAKNKVPLGWISKWWFVLKYNCYNYLGAALKKLK